MTNKRQRNGDDPRAEKDIDNRTVRRGIGSKPTVGFAHCPAQERGCRCLMCRDFATKTQKTRKIPLMPQVAELTRKLMETAPKGSGITLFRNSKGTVWTSVAGVQRYLAIKRKLGWDEDPIRKHYSSYTCRHTFCHRMLSGYWNGGIDPADAIACQDSNLNRNSLG